MSRLVAAWRRHLAPLSLLMAAWIWFVGALPREPGNLFLIDTSLIDVPFRVAAARLLREGSFPFWTSQIECGFPLFADGQTGVLYPPFVLYVLSPTPAMHDLFMALHYLGAGLAMYLFLLGRRLLLLAAALGGCIFFAAPVLLAAHVVPGIVSTIAWLPLALWCIDRYAEGRRSALWWCAVVNCVLLLAGMPNAALLCLIVEAAYLIFTLGRRGYVALLRCGLVIFAMGVALAAVQLLPTYDYFRQSHRGEGLDWAAIETNCVRTPREIATIGVCRAVDLRASWFGYAVVVLAATVAAFTNRLQRRETWFWLALAIFGLALATGTPVLRLWYFLPVVSWFRWPMFYVLVTHLAASVLVGLGADCVLQSLTSRISTAAGARAALVFASCATAVVAAGWNTLGQCQSPAGFYDLGSPTILETARRESYSACCPFCMARSKGESSLSTSGSGQCAVTLIAPRCSHPTTRCCTACRRRFSRTRLTPLLRAPLRS